MSAADPHTSLPCDPATVTMLREMAQRRAHRPGGCLVSPCGWCRDTERLLQLADALEHIGNGVRSWEVSDG